MLVRNAIVVAIVGGFLAFVSSGSALAATPEDALRTEGEWRFNKSQLKGVADSISRFAKVPVKLAKDVDGTAMIDIKHNGTLKDVLKLMLTPLGLDYGFDDKQIFILKKKSDK